MDEQEQTTAQKPRRRKRPARLLNKIARGSAKLARRAARRLSRLFKATWKALKRAFKPRGRRKKPQPPPHVLVPRLVIFACLVCGLLVASLLSTRLDTKCVLPLWVGDPVIQRHWLQVRQWCPLIMRAGARYHLDPHLIAAIIRVESAGNPRAYSHSGAVGLMQVMPRDGLAAAFQCPKGPCFAYRPTIRQLQDPAFNVNYGSRLLADYLAKYGSLRDALRAYGPRDYGYIYADYVLAVYEKIGPSR